MRHSWLAVAVALACGAAAARGETPASAPTPAGPEAPAPAPAPETGGAESAASVEGTGPIAEAPPADTLEGAAEPEEHVGAATNGEATDHAPEPPPLPTGQELFERFGPAVVVVEYAAHVPQQPNVVRVAHQAGLLVDATGLVMLSGHVQALELRPFHFQVLIGDEKYPGNLLEREGQLNVSYVQMELPAAAPPDPEADAAEPGDDAAGAPTLRTVTFDEAVEARIGEDVWVFGILPEQAGFAKYLRRQRVAAVLEEPSLVYVLDRQPNPGDNGGLVLTRDGRPLGVLGFELSTQQGGEIFVRHSLPLVFPGAQLAESISRPREAAAEPEQQAWFGLLLQPLHEGFKEYFALEDRTGCIISNVVRDSPAERAGLERGDIIVEFRGEPVDVPNDLAVLTFTRSVRELPVGTPLSLKYLRDGAEHETTVELVPIPKTAAKAATFHQPAWGLRVRELTNDVIYLLNLPPDIAGVVVDTVEPGGPAQLAGLQPGDVIRELNRSPVDGLAAYQDSTDQLAGMRSEKIVLFVQRGPRTGFSTLAPDWRLPARDDG